VIWPRQARAIREATGRVETCDDSGVRGLALAVVVRACRDAVSGGGRAAAAQEWLRSDGWAETLCDGCGIDQGRLVSMMDTALRRSDGSGGQWRPPGRLPRV